MNAADLNSYLKGRGWWWIFAAFCTWTLRGVFPLVSYESDALSICTDCERAFREGWTVLGGYGYGYWMQPLVYILGCAARHCGLPAQEFYCLFSALSALGFVLLSVIFIHRLSGLSRALAILALWLIPESYALAMYPNSTAPAMLCVTAGMLCALHRRSVACALLLCVAVLLRLDVVLVYPVLPLLLMHAGMAPRRAWTATLMTALSVIAVIWPVYSLLGASAGTTFHTYMHWTAILDTPRRMLALIGFYGLLGMPLLLGGLIIMWRRARSLFRIVLVTLVCVHIPEAPFGNAAKHFAPLLPFVGLAAAFALAAIDRHSRRPWAVAAICAICAVQIFGLSLNPDFGSAYRRYRDPDALTGINLVPASGRCPAGLRLGLGEEFNTADEAVTLGGYALYPVHIHRIKQDILRRMTGYRRVRASLPESYDIGLYSFEEESRLRLEIALDGRAANTRRINLRVPHDRDSVAALDEIADSLHAAGHPLLLPDTEPLSAKYAWTLRALRYRGTIREIRPHIYLYDPHDPE